MSFLTTLLSAVGAIAGNINKAPIRLNAKIITNASGTANTLGSNLVRHFAVEGLKEAYKILGSLEIIGNPVGLVSNLGDGVMDFFYEPAQCLMERPSDFGRGVAKGSSSLVTHLSGGVFGAASAITGSVSKGLSVLSMDKEFQENQGKAKESKHVVDGVLEGGKSVAQGLAGGISGIIIDPIKGAREGGIKGLGKGLVTGLVGAVVKPTAGVLGGVSSTLQGLGNTAGYVLNENLQNKPVRPQRVLEKGGRLVRYTTADRSAATGELVL